eukprot:GHVL01018548.1.p1 GENE.GHVL01018548.1~~GHVL01018548.1.p1  ORF type:complete len:356 (-),score=63.69 GHVL01018548.1:132-1139(-)
MIRIKKKIKKKNSILKILDISIIDRIILYTIGYTLLDLFLVNSDFFIGFYDALIRMCEPIDDAFKNRFELPGSLCLENSRIDWSPVHVSQAGIRFDRILTAKVTPRHANRCVMLSYRYKYKYEECRSKLSGAVDNNFYETIYKFDLQRKGSQRRFWLHHDMCRFHGDETRVVSSSTVPPLCADDRIEIAVNIFNMQGLVDIDNLKWCPLQSEAISRRQCPVEEGLYDWYDLDTFQAQTVERLQIPDFFAPQWKHEITEFAGIDIAVSRSKFKAHETGEVSEAQKILRSKFEVIPRGQPIIMSLKRLGLQHDRFTPTYIRQGDEILLYWSQGGKVN